MWIDARVAQRSGWLPRVLFGVAGPVCRRLFRLRVEGGEHLPAVGAAIIAANHLSFFDSVVLALAVPRRLSFVGKAEYLDSWKTRRLFPALGMIPVDRAARGGPTGRCGSPPACWRPTSCSLSIRKGLVRRTGCCATAATASAIWA